MFHTEDYDLLRSMVGIETPDDDLVTEYDKRQRLFHRGHGSGPLGVAMMVDLLRFMHYAAKPTKKADGSIDWKSHLGARVEARGDEESSWKIGNLHSIASAGRLVVKHDGTEQLEEYQSFNVRLAEEKPDELPKSDVSVEHERYPFEAADGGEPVLVQFKGVTIQGEYVGVAAAQIDIEDTGDTLLSIKVVWDGVETIEEFTAREVAITG